MENLFNILGPLAMLAAVIGFCLRMDQGSKQLGLSPDYVSPYSITAYQETKTRALIKSEIEKAGFGVSGRVDSEEGTCARVGVFADRGDDRVALIWLGIERINSQTVGELREEVTENLSTLRLVW